MPRRDATNENTSTILEHFLHSFLPPVWRVLRRIDRLTPFEGSEPLLRWWWFERWSKRRDSLFSQLQKPTAMSWYIALQGHACADCYCFMIKLTLFQLWWVQFSGAAYITSPIFSRTNVTHSLIFGAELRIRRSIHADARLTGLPQSIHHSPTDWCEVDFLGFLAIWSVEFEFSSGFLFATCINVL